MRSASIARSMLSDTIGQMKQTKPTIWVIMHYEFIGLPQSPYIDSVQFHVSSSLKKAEKYIRDRVVDAHSWWQVHPHVLDADSNDEGSEVHYYSHRGTPLKTPPMKRARASFLKHVARYPEFYPSPSAET
jgi:hypothetical protein